MGWNKFHVEIFNGLQEEEYTADYDENDNAIKATRVVPKWYELQRFDDSRNADSRAKAQSTKNPEELYRVHHNYWDDTYDIYYRNGELVAKREFAKRNDEKEPRWHGDEIPAYPPNQQYKIEVMSDYNFVDPDSFREDNRSIYRKAVLVAVLKKRGWTNENKLYRVTAQDGSKLYFYNYAEINEAEAEEWLEAKRKAKAYRDSFVLARGADYVGSVTIDNHTFETPFTENIAAQIEHVAQIFANAAAASRNEDVAYISNQLHVALENIRDKMANRD